MRIKANIGSFRTYLDKKRFFLLPEEQRVWSKGKAYKRKVWQDRITGEKWSFVENGYRRLNEVEDKLVAEG